MTTVVVATAYGGPEVLALHEVELGEPGPGDVLVDLHAIGANPYDAKAYSGQFGTDPARLPMRIGSEAAGIVRAVGSGAEGPGGPIQVGDEVIVYPVVGAYAGAVIAPATSILPKPSTMDFEEASGLILAGVTAVHALMVTAVAAGDTVLIHGASGGVGLMAVQLAHNSGARVIATASASRHEYLRGLGAEPVLYGEGLAERVRALAPEGVDAALDLIGTDEALDVSVELVANRERIATINGFAHGFELGVKVLGFAPGADAGQVVRGNARMEIVRQAEAKNLAVLIAASYPLAEVAEAHRALKTAHTHGKIVLIP
jgi:NADPH:quinone reductase-like Zn-dependent oxidoreductase